MEERYKTLILVDNSLSVKKGSQQIIKETLTYLFEHAGDEEDFSLAVFGEEISYLKEYGTDRQELITAAEQIVFENKDTYITDVLMNVVNEWREADFACRSILLVTDGLTEESSEYPDEELYFTLDKTDYPVYVIGCVQNDNQTVMKHLAAIARISSGEIFYTEFEDSEASVECKIGDAVLAAMLNRHNEERADENYRSEEEEPLSAEEKVSENSLLLSDSMDTEAVIYEKEISKDELFLHGRSGPMLFLGITSVLLVLLSVCFFMVKKNLKRKRHEKKFMEDLKSEVKRHSQYLKSDDEEQYGVTQALHEKTAGVDENATRCLFGPSEMQDITLEDRSDPTKFFRTSCIDRLVLGRSLNMCDLVIDYDDSVSGRHCEICMRESGWFVRDLQSSNGTLVNGQKVYQELELHSGDVLQLGRLRFIVRMQDTGYK
ncbi:MAG TPA: FHA domain-containing protein [Lachnospiraceae bacterium]|nr:FHA domain-containing protein [Lachnospiraceae bacterium]